MALSLKAVGKLSIALSLCSTVLLISGAIALSPIREWLFLIAVPTAVSAFAISRLFRLRRFEVAVDHLRGDVVRRRFSKYVRIDVTVVRALEGLIAVCGLVLLVTTNGLFQIGSGIGLLTLGCAVVFLERNTQALWRKTQIVSQ